MKRMNLVMKDDVDDAFGGSGGGGKYECENCRTEFPNKTTMDRHALFCKTLADIRRGGSGGGAAAGVSTNDDPLMPTQREMFVLIQELAAKYNKVKDDLDVMKQWAKMVGRRIAGGGSSSALAGLDFTSITRQKRQNMEVILNDEDAENPDLAGLRLGFAEWIMIPDLAAAVTNVDLNVVFNEDLVAGITAAILRVLAQHTAESGKSHLIPFKLADIKQGAFCIYDTVFGVVATAPQEIGPDPPTTPRKWRAMEPCEFQLLVRTFHKLLFKEFKKWQDRNWDAQQQMTQKRKKAASTYQHMMSGMQYQCSPAMASCDGMYPMPGAEASSPAMMTGIDDDDEATTPVSSSGGGTVLTEDFATLYNKYADKMMGGALSDDTIVARVRAKLWKDMKAWRL